VFLPLEDGTHPARLLRGEAEDRTGQLNAVDVYALSYWRVNPFGTDPYAT